MVHEWARKFFEDAKDRMVMGAHGFDHNQRVSGRAARIAKGEGYDIFLPALTSLIFDIGRTSTDPRADNYLHGQLSREMSEDFLRSLTILTDEQRELVANAIEDHPRFNEQVRISYVVKVVMDADRLDTLGALGPLRAAATRWKLPLVLPDESDTRSGDTEIRSIFQDIAYRQLGFFEMLWTDTARNIAESQVVFHKQFIEELKKDSSLMYQDYKNLLGL